MHIKSLRILRAYFSFSAYLFEAYPPFNINKTSAVLPFIKDHLKATVKEKFITHDWLLILCGNE